MNDARKYFLNFYDNLYADYQRIDPNYSMPDAKKAFWIEGSNGKALFLAHGYLGTPAEMLTIAKPFLNEGYTVIGFLIPGHGGHSRITNSYKKNDWQETIKQCIQWAQTDHSEIHVCGFSTGGLLLHDYLRNNPAGKIKSAHLVSPYFIPRIKTFFDNLLEKILNNKSVDTLYALSRMPDLKVTMIDREFYNQELPATTAKEIKELGKIVFNAPATNIEIPVQLFLTDGDWTVAIQSSKKVLERDARNLTIVHYKNRDPHHLMVPSVSNVALDVQQKIFSLIKSL